MGRCRVVRLKSGAIQEAVQTIVSMSASGACLAKQHHIGHVQMGASQSFSRRPQDQSQ